MLIPIGYFGLLAAGGGAQFAGAHRYGGQGSWLLPLIAELWASSCCHETPFPALEALSVYWLLYEEAFMGYD